MTRPTSRPRIIAPQLALNWTRDVRADGVDTIDIADLQIAEGMFEDTVSKVRLERLGDALRTLGYPTALPVRDTGGRGGTAGYVLTGGHRFYRAAQLVLATGTELAPDELQRVRQVPIAIDRGMDPPSTIITLLTGVDRLKIPPLDVARAFSDLKARAGWSNLHIGIAFGVSEGKVYGYGRVAAEPELVAAVEAGMKITVAMALAEVKDSASRAALLAAAREGKRLKVADVTGKCRPSIIDDISAPDPEAHLHLPEPMPGSQEERGAHFVTVTRIFVQGLNADDDRGWDSLQQSHAIIDTALVGRHARQGAEQQP